MDAAGTTTLAERKHLWGLDLSETEQGAGGVGGLLMTEETTGVHAGTHYFTYDGNGNVMNTVHSDGTVTATYEYDPFGKLVSQSGTYAPENPFCFSTKHYNHETKLSYYGYRFYHADLGRWINRDPIEEEGGMNLYGFVFNNAKSFYDVLGEAAASNHAGKGSGNSGSASGTVPAFFDELKDAVINSTGSVSYSNSVPIGAIGPATFNLSFSATGGSQACCAEDGKKSRMVVGSFTVGIDGGIGAVADANGEGSQATPGSSSGAKGGTGGGVSSNSGQLPKCETKWLPLSFNIDAQAVGGLGKLGGGFMSASITQPVASCDASANCNWTYSQGVNVGIGDGGFGARVQLIATGSIGFQYYLE
ncbi:MAG: RHS repeat-associated core domain-containing protein [Verrucomicrobiota bacterium]